MACALPVQAEESKPSEDAGTMIVTAPAMTDPLTVDTDPKAPRQPVPASDGASFLKNIPGFSVTRKGGTDGDPTFRGLAGSRLNILQNGDYIFGGCGMRMDPPTAYIYPETFDSVKVVKGPQTVLYGGGNIAGTVLFDRETQRFEESGSRFFASGMAGSFGRRDAVVDASAGVKQGFVRLIATNSQMKDYEDGDGRDVHSSYRRWSVSELMGWTPSADSRVELNLDFSDGQAAYADRTMDGAKFARTGYGLRYETRNLSSLVERLELKAYHNYVDHVMDNFSLRQSTGMKMISNPDRTTKGARVESQLAFGGATYLVGGLDYQDNEHSLRTASSMMTPTVSGKPRIDDAEFSSQGIFGELHHDLAPQSRLVGGLRVDDAKAKALAAFGTVAVGTSDDNTNLGGFLRYELDLGEALTVSAGLGQAERSPDYWERKRFFFLDSEKSNQLDAGLKYRSSVLRANLSLYYTQVDNYILITPTGAQNVDATLYGGEADVSYFLTKGLHLDATAAYTRGANDTYDTPLAQVAPPEATLGVGYDDAVWSAAFLARGVMKQNRVQVGYGTIVGTDLGETGGFVTLAVNGGYRCQCGTLFTAGVDNLLDKTYAEHISRAGAMVSGFTQTERVNELGRFFWVKASIDI
jgi:iron complex outermembrane receptor protein